MANDFSLGFNYQGTTLEITLIEIIYTVYLLVFRSTYHTENRVFIDGLFLSFAILFGPLL